MQSVGVLLACMLVGCSLDSMVDVNNPEVGREVDNKLVVTRAGALGMYYKAIGSLRTALSEKSLRVGLLTDELTQAASVTKKLWVLGDARIESYRPDMTKGLDVGQLGVEFTQLQAARVHANQARAILRLVDDSTLVAAIAGTYAIEGYSILMLAEDFCSGVPITDVPFQGDVVYGVALSTAELFTLAITKFDSALAISHDSASITALARIGMARAYLGIGNYEQAARAVADVIASDGFYLDYTPNVDPNGSTSSAAFWTNPTTIAGSVSDFELVEIINQEGENGLRWFDDATKVDPRLPVTTVISGNNMRTFPAEVRQRKFVSGTVRFSLARAVEAQMIRAEFALHEGDPAWITPVNDARATVGLTALVDPVTTNARVDMLFRERAFWFYLEGVRLADYRRLVRQYERDPYTVYPVGSYTRSSGEAPFYGEAWVLVTPWNEVQQNFRYHGCHHTRP